MTVTAVVFGVGRAADGQCAQWLERVPAFRKELALRYAHTADMARSLLAYRLLSKLLGYAPLFQYNAWGKPYLPQGPCFNMTHGGDCAAVCLSTREAGIDAERIRPAPFDMMRRVFTAAEIKRIERSDTLFFTYWTLKESYGKALGKGLSFPLTDVEFNVTDGGVECSDTGYTFTTQTLNGHQISTCNAESNSIRVFDLTDL